MNDLYYPSKPKSKLEEYNEKLKERELYTNNILDRFIENGSGAPKHDKNGNLMAKRRKFLDDSVDFTNRKRVQTLLSQQNINRNNNDISNTSIANSPIYQLFNEFNANNNRNSKGNNLIIQTNKRYSNNILNNNGLINALDQNQLNEINKNKNINDNIKRNTLHNINNNIIVQNGNENYNEEVNEKIYKSNNYVKKNHSKNYEEDNIFDNNYKGLGILPRNSDDDKVQRFLRQEALKAELKIKIEERKLRKEREKQLQKELDLKEDLKVQKAIEEEKQLVKFEKRRKEEY